MEEEHIDWRTRRVNYDRPKETDAIDYNLTLTECLERRAVLSRQLSEVATAIDSIRTQLEGREVEQITTGVPTDMVWKRKATSALRYSSRSHEDHNRAIKNLNSRIKFLEFRKDSRHMAFVESAKVILPEPIFNSIWSLVDAGGAGFVGVTAVQVDAAAQA
jgi:hypothetical protein